MTDDVDRDNVEKDDVYGDDDRIEKQFLTIEQGNAHILSFLLLSMHCMTDDEGDKKPKAN
jgi:hypothetical protein